MAEFIIYLEPTKNSVLWTQVQAYFEASQSYLWAQNEAARYPAHITMVGFFTIPTTSVFASASEATTPINETDTIVDKLISSVTQRINSSDSVFIAETTLVQGLVRPSPDSLLIAIQPSPMLLDWAQALKDAFPELELRLKKTNHLSLCYWIGQEAIPENGIRAEEVFVQHSRWTDQAEQLARSVIPLMQGMTGASMGVVNNSWDIVLYTIHNRDRSCPQPYPLVEVQRWTLA
ncbi:hypothetical protein BG011_010099 [Mortierella polycephala]|uniref:2'-5' RNA ligase family protein n=1 Tax=Mortierella polycephala TaxID=41804 RepID=A0A9P6U7G8_9FUNG|nr:hypothetical protein BG011_010099 [Mortierella polycephala]